MAPPTKISVMELPSKQLYTVHLPNEEGGDMVTVEKFVSVLEGHLSKTCKILMVGRKVIDLKKDADRSVHYFLLNNAPWYAHTTSKIIAHTTSKKITHITSKTSENITLRVQHYSRSFTIRVDGSATVEEIHREIEDKKYIPMDSFYCMHGATPLDRGTLITTYQIQNESMIFLFGTLKGGNNPGGKFVNVLDKAGPKKHHWNDSAPKWRRARKGLSLEGKCINKRCKAYRKMVIMNVGYDEFDFLNDGYTCQCPLCDQQVIPTTCGFNNCKWKVVGRQVQPRKPPEMFRTDWKVVGDYYDRFSPEENGTANFLDLKIICEDPKATPTCTVCAVEIQERMEERAECGHVFHSGRCSVTAVGSNGVNCIECISRRSMTPYQQLFAEERKSLVNMFSSLFK